jgi:hypothetical protein
MGLSNLCDSCDMGGMQDIRLKTSITSRKAIRDDVFMRGSIAAGLEWLPRASNAQDVDARSAHDGFASHCSHQNQFNLYDRFPMINWLFWASWLVVKSSPYL